MHQRLDLALRVGVLGLPPVGLASVDRPREDQADSPEHRRVPERNVRQRRHSERQGGYQSDKAHREVYTCSLGCNDDGDNCSRATMCCRGEGIGERGSECEGLKNVDKAST
jgi:hypothetical protein